MKKLALTLLLALTGCGIEAAICRQDAICFECKVVSDGGIIFEETEQVAKTADGKVWVEDAGVAPIEKRLIEVRNAEASCYFFKCTKECK